MKTCVRCHRDLALNAFHRDRSRPDGHFPWCRECCKAWKAANDSPEKRRRNAERARLWNLAHPDVLARCIREWGEAHPEARRATTRNYQHRRRSNTVASDVTRQSWDVLAATFGGRCFWCEQPSERLEMDHVVPVSRGGRHLLSNLVPACRSCNASKHAAQPLLFVVRCLRLAEGA